MQSNPPSSPLPTGRQALQKGDILFLPLEKGGGEGFKKVVSNT